MKSFAHLLNEINEGSTHAALTSDLAERTFVLRLSILTSDKGPSLVLRIQNLEAHVEEMGQQLCALVFEAINGAMPVLMGSYSKAG